MAAWGSQFSSGEQSQNVKESFWRSGFSVCQNTSCSSRNTNSGDNNWKNKNNKKTIGSKDFPAGCRMNGDGYGTTVFTCAKCNWQTSFQYDDAAEVYYYETQHYKDVPDPPAVPHLWSSVNLKDWCSQHHIPQEVQSKLQTYALGKEELSEMSVKHFMALGLKTEQARILATAVDKTNNELLLHPADSSTTTRNIDVSMIDASAAPREASERVNPTTAVRRSRSF
mmetsp:Transcript_24052/g.33611  ORF Transcript_24052/g.33611 Transcript_24052/m.33611 type:complete len:225 (-) Transcript_24052:172-846(-)